MKPACVLLLLIPALASAAAVRVKVVGEACPLAAELKSSSGLQVVDRDFDVEAVLEREGAEWQVLLRKPDGTVALRRTLVGAKQCADVSFAARLIIERFARELDVKVAIPERSRGGDASPAPAPPVPAPLVAKAPAPTVDPTPPVPARPVARPSVPTTPAPTAPAPTPAVPTAPAPTPAVPTPAVPTPAVPTTAAPTTAAPTTAVPTPAVPTPPAPTAPVPTTPAPTTPAPTTPAPTTPAPTPPAPTPPAPTPSPASAPSGPTAALGSNLPQPVGPRLRGLRLSRWEISASGAAWFALGSTPRPGFEASAALFLSDTWRVSAEFALTSTETFTILDEYGGGERGKLTTQPFLALATGGYCLGAPLRPCGSLVAGAHLETAGTSGDYIYQSKNLWLARPAFGLELQLAWLPIQQLAVALSATALVLPVAGAWTIEKIPSATRSLPLFEGLVRLSIGFGANR